MFDLIAYREQTGNRQRFVLTEGDHLLGRSERVELSMPWEPSLSMRHLKLLVGEQHIDAHHTGANPVFFRGEPQQEFRLRDGDCFVVGETIFQIARHAEADSSTQDRMIEEIAFDAGQLSNIPFSDADKRIEVLTHLPEIIQDTHTEEDFFLKIAQLLLAGVPRSEAVAIVQADESGVDVLHWDRRDETAGTIHPSSRLVRDALLKTRRSVLHLWEGEHANADPQYTATADFGWAFCTPVFVPGEPARGLYIAGRHEISELAKSDDDGSAILQSDVRFTELVAEIVGSLRRLSSLERQQAGLRQFFAPPILKALGDELNTDVLEPRECDVTVLFCDLRGFSQHAEHSADDLTGLLSRVSQALGVMTQQILRFEGVTGDFQGDAALGFWGWPFDSEQAPLNAARAALGIRSAFREFAGLPDHPLSQFEMGIGIAHGRAVAGKIGTSDQVKVTVFGPVVNLASRLETMTSQLRVPILLDEATTELVRSSMPRDEGRTRRLGRIVPVGMETAVQVSELLPPEADFPELTDEHLAQYEEAVEHFTNGDWENAWQCLHNLPAGDRAQDFLAMPIVQHNRTAPADWDGIIRLTQK
jgi:adenylate cyclase